MESVSDFLKRKAKGETQREDPVRDFLRKKAGAEDAGAYTPGVGKSGRPGVVLTPQPSEEPETPAQTGRLRPGWSVEDVVEATEPKSLYQKALDKIDQAKDKAEAARRFGNMSTEDLLSYVPTSKDDKRLYETYMGSRLEAAKSLERQSKQAKNDAAKAGNEAEAYREFLGMPGASNEEIFGLAQAVRANNAQAKSLEPQRWLEYAEGLKESEGKKQSLTEQGRELKRRADAANEQGQVWEYSNVIKSYGELINSPDFAKKSQYNPNETSPTYRAINGDTAARNQLLDSGSKSRGFSPVTGENNLLGYRGADNDYLFELTDAEKGIYNALYASSPEAADNFVEKLKPYLESRARSTFQNYAAAMAQRYPGTASAATVPAGELQSAEYVKQIGDLISTGKINQNSAKYRASQMSSTVRGEVAKMVEAKWGKVGSFAYNTGMSMADFLTTTAVGGGTKALSLALMGTRAASNTVLNLKDRGLDDTAAFTLGSIAGAAEIVTESFSLEKLLNPNLVADGIATNIFKNVLTEASEEGASNLINLAAERIYDAITGNNEAEWKQKVYDAIQNGADPNDAVLAAIQDNLVQLGMDMLSGGISGGLMSAAGTPFYLNNFNASQQGQYANAIRGDEEGLQALIQSGLESPQNTESRQRAEKVEYQVAKGKTPSTLDVARLVEANQQQINNETAEQSGQGRFRLTLPRTTPQNAPTPEQVETLRQIGAPLPAGANTAQEAPPVPQETRNTSGLTLPARTTQSTDRAAEAPRLTLPTQDTQAATEAPPTPSAEQVSAFDEQAESELVERLAKSKPGLMVDDYARSKLSENEIRAIDETAKRLGLRVAFVDKVRGGKDNARVYLDNGVVLIEKNNPNPIGYLFGHEMGHWLQQHSPDAYKEFLEAARATSPEWFKQREQKTIDTYEAGGEEYTPELIQEEVLCDYAGWLVQDEDALNRFIEQNRDKPNVLRRLYEAIKALAAKLTGRERQQANTAADLLLRAMNETEASVQNGIMSTGGTRSSFGGILAQHADMEAQARAEDLHTRGNRTKERGPAFNNYVRKKTGWFKGGDGMWRFEIDDHDSRVTVGEPLKHLNDSGYKTLSDLLYDYDPSIWSTNEDEINDLRDRYIYDLGYPEPDDVAQKFATGHGTVGDVLDHEELYRQYPFIATVPLKFENLGPTTLGSTTDRGITLNTSLLSNETELRSTLLHEIQHLIQREEGFARGSNPRYWQQQIDNGMDTARPSEASALREYNRIKAENPGLVRDVLKVTRMFEEKHDQYRYVDADTWENKETGELIPRDGVWGEYDKLESEMESEYGDTLNKYFEVLATLGASPEEAEVTAITGPAQRSALEMYEDTYGEEEARNVQFRARLNPEEANAIQPFTGHEDSVFVEPGFRDRSKSSMKGLDAPSRVLDSDYMAAVNSDDTETAQRIVSAAADAAMPDSKVRNASTGELRYVYHYTNNNFYEFRPMGQSAGSNRTLGDGYYVSTSETEFKSFGKNKMTLFANITNPFEMELNEEQAQAVYDKYFRPYHEDRFHTYEPHVVGKLQSYSQVFDYLKEAAEKNGTTTSAILSELGFDGVHDGPEWVAFYPEQLKSADVATYNDDGQLIPLSERFNPEEKDTRYSLKGLNADIAPESIQKYGQIPKGEKPARDVNVPKKVTGRKNERVSWTVRTAAEAKVTPDAALPTIEEMVRNGSFSYEVQSNKDAIAKATDTIKDKGWSASLADWMKDVTAGKVNKDNTAMGWALYNNAVNSGDIDTAMTVLDLIVRHQRTAAQALQASRILKQLSPEAQLYGIQRSVDNLIRELQERYGKRKNINIQINRDLAQAFLDAKTDEERQKAKKALFKDIGSQVPATFLDKWNAWRYLAMLGNPRTHVRNIAGNTGFAPVVLAKDQVATILEGIASAVSKGKVERTKGLVLPVRDHDLVKAAWDRYQSVRDEALGEGKYNDRQMENRWIEEGRTIFKFKPLELARRANSTALDVEDVWFSQPHYTYALAQYCKANGITPAQIRSGDGMDKADAYAIKEAQKATYRDTNAFSSFVSSLGRTMDRKTWVGKAASTVLEGVLPFRKTPANILARGVEYSPIGLLKSLTYDMAQVMSKDEEGNPKMSVAQMLDDVSAGLTGTGLLALGGLLAKLGILRGRGDDDKKKRDFYDLMGYQQYAITLPNGESYTLDWLAPESLPVFVGVNIYEKLQQDNGDLKMADLLSAISQISEPMLEMSMLQSLNDAFEAIGYAQENELSPVTQVLSSAVTSYLTQAIPTLGGQIERTGENVRMTTYRDKNKWLTPDVQYTLGKISTKIPGWDYNQIPYIDAWGRQEATGDSRGERSLENMISPGYTDKTNVSDMEKELERLYDADPDKYKSVLPTSHKAKQYVEFGGERIDLTAEQYVDYATTKGQTAFDLMTDLVKTEEYKNASDDDKAKMVDSVYDYAATIAKGELLESLGNTYDDYVKLKTKLDKGADILDMIALTQEIKAADEAGNANKSYDTLEKLTAVEALGLPEAKAEPLLEQQLSEGQWEKYSTLKDADVNYDTRLDIMRKYAELDSNDEMKPGEKALEFSHYVDSHNLTSKQTQLVKDTYKFWSMVPAEAKRYETFKQAGLSEDKSKHTAEVLSALEPLPGKEDVTDLQRYRAIESDKELTNAEKIKVIGSIMGTELKTENGNPTQWAKFNTALNNGQTLSQAIDLCENGSLDEYVNWMDWSKEVTPERKVDSNVYIKFQKTYNSTSSTYDETTGKAIKGQEKKDKVMAYIDGLNLTIDQKDGLYLTRYKESTLDNTPWHNKGGSSGRGKTYAPADTGKLRLPPSARMDEQDRELWDMESHGGNVNLRTRKTVPVTKDNINTVRGWGMESNVGDYMTVASQTYRDGNRAIVVTPILPSGKLMTQAELDDYMDSLRGSDSYADADDRGIILGVFDNGSWQQNLRESDAFAERIHELHEEREEKRKTTGLKLPSAPQARPTRSGLKLKSAPEAQPDRSGLKLR